MKLLLHVDVENYDIEISDNSFSSLLYEIEEYTAEQRKLYVVSQKVFNIYRDSLNFKLNEVLILPDGEKEKNVKNYLKIIKKATELGLTRKDVIIAFGGGVIGDLAGFAASTYMRGIDYIQIPTTLLSMVDSSVGGKTAIDLSDAKNIIGTFYQPKRVFININFLKTLDSRQYKSGLGEILKYAFIEKSVPVKDSIFLYEYLLLCVDKIFEKDSVTLIRIIDYCLRLKIAVVNADEKEASLRKILNLGHTLGHAIEVATKFKKYTHGEAVIFGIFFAFDVATELGLIDYSYYRQSIDLLKRYNFSYINLAKFSTTRLLDYMRKDKKAVGNSLVFILPNGKKTVTEKNFLPEEIIRYF